MDITQKLKKQDELHTEELKKLAIHLKNTEVDLNEAVTLGQLWNTQLKEREAEYERLAKTSETDKAYFQRLAQQEQARTQELTEQLETLQDRVSTAKAEAKAVQQEVEARPFRNPLKNGGQGPQMIIIPSGSFKMGSPETEVGRFDHEGPQHTVTISRPFALSIYEITFAEYDTFAQATGRRSPGDEGWGRGQRPVIDVSWDDADAYAQWLSDQTGERYRLPTEAEWEYAARADSKTAYSFGDAPHKLNEYAWYIDNSGGKTHPVGQRKPNTWGLYDMHGNVWEWVQDWYGVYAARIVSDPQGPVSGAARVVRGGGWYVDARDCRGAIRGINAPGVRVHYLGFRLARSVALGP